MLLEDRIAIVSGIGPGMGREIALAVTRNGAHVALAARTASDLSRVVTGQALDVNGGRFFHRAALLHPRGAGSAAVAEAVSGSAR